MKRTKKLISVLLCFVLLTTLVVAFESTAYGQVYSGTTGGVSYSLDTDTGVLTLRKTDGGTGRTAGYSTTSRSPWYNQRTYVRSVVAESGVVELGSYLLYNCTNLTSVTLADSVDTIGGNCFKNCTRLTGVLFPSGCSWIYDNVFNGCTGLTWVVMPNANYTNNYSGKIPDGMFYGCTGLKQVYVGTEFTGLGSQAFYNCSSLEGVIWGSGSISSVGTNALYNVPSTCTFVSTSGLSSWCNSYSKVYMSNTGTCSTNTYSSSRLTYTINLSNRVISFTGSGTMTSKPWECVRYVLESANFSGVDGQYTIMNDAFNGAGLYSVVFDTTSNLTIGSQAFANLFRSTYWLNIPINTTSIGSKAFDGCGFNYVTIASNSVNMASDAFTLSGYARFFGKQGSGVREFVENGKTNGKNWFFFCYGDTHVTTQTTVAPTCTEQGYDVVTCANCDMANERTNFTEPLGHAYQKTGDSGSNFIYTCSRCGVTNLTVDAVTVYSLFENAISHDNDNAPYHQSNYDGAADVLRDGYVNAKDSILIKEVLARTDTTNKKTVIDESTKYQTIEGFGASGAWTGQQIGTWENIDEITELLYNEETGIGLDIYRYNLGAGSNDDPQLYEVGKRARCFLQSDGTYNWNNDPGAMATLASIQKANPNLKVTLFCNSAPVSMTDNGKAYCSMNATQNLSENKYQAFTNYVITCGEHFIDEGYNVTELSPINEPEWAWACWQNGDGTYSMNQEGCHYEPEAVRTFFNNYFIPSVKNSSLNGIDVAVWECAQINHGDDWNARLNNCFSTNYNYSSNNSNIRSYCDTLDIHSYWASQSDREATASKISGTYFRNSIKKVKCSEYCQMTNDGSSGVYDLIQQEGGSTNGMTIDYGIALADIMYQDLTILNAVEWDWWLAYAYGIYPDGLVYLNPNNHSDIQPSKRAWCMGNYSKFVDVGAQRVKVTTQSAFSSNIEETAYLNPDGTVAIVYINKGTSNEFTYFDSAVYSTLTSYITDENRDLQKVQNGSVDGKAVLIPARSVTTVVLTK